MAEELMYKSEPTLGEKVDKLTELVEKGELTTKKPKRFMMPLKGKVSKARQKKGYVTILEIAENGTWNFTREQIIDGTIKMGDTFHAVDDKDCGSYKGKPAIIIPKKSKEPYNPNYIKNTTFSQKHIMSRMMNETIDVKKKLGGLGMSIGAILLVAVLAYAFIAG